ncbi:MULTISPECIES: TonB-dependent siderophore receptor [unclassified Rhizobium]|uniref:TonB-dependent siderophore receptor n=1 Tax=unclassified Rhizobium TaxID=2613769 RepID=UPI001ADBC88B|nr:MULTISPECIES: TonB-dependent siderophore receptor [unclassified Rhizobium]MBO9100591.1 TonB-dependent siderophore receptor [Rhizobium sp. L58/93]MBO9136047.1 TonB-dependent siderophore receptor [Rhizobium sp. B209b/85]MBO9171358.1 TonB-dependent siderophore receptor [Rhizobium sp. L245/93]MBO9187225.1 TonB-dependent siderophore receptor [Rhizobium sp. E27B/91]QXZ87909.1 TonB-dependent siderophore receptor [Rhizobium sp. K1/93]
MIERRAAGRYGPNILRATALALAACAAYPAFGEDAQPAATAETDVLPKESRIKGDTVLKPIVVGKGSNAATQGYQPISTVTATRTDTPLLDIPQAVNVVSQDVLRDQNARSLDDALANISGVAQSNTLGGTQESIIRRGFGDNRDGSILIDGMKTAMSRSFNATTDRVEVLKGPASTLYGILDPGGMINVVTKKPEQTFSGKTYTSVSSFGGGSAGFDFTGPIEGTDLSYRFVGDYKHVDYWRNFGVNKDWVLSPSLTWSGEDTEVTVSYTHEDYSVPFDRGTIFDLATGHAVDVDPKIRFDEPYNISKGQSNLASVHVKRDLGDDWKLTFDYTYSINTYSDNQARVISYNAATGILTRRADATQGSTIYNHAVRTDLSGDVDIAGFRNELLFGTSYDYADTLRTKLIRCANRTGFNINNPTYGTLPECTTVSAADSDQTEQISTASFYAQDALHLNDQWTLVGGFRYQYYDLMAGKGRPFNENTDSFGTSFVPRGGIVYKVTPDFSLYANAAKTFRPQSSIASYYGNLDPEEGVAYEVGAKFDLLDGITANVALYTSDKKNVAYSSLDPATGDTVVKTAGLVRASGIEADLAGEITDEMSFIASYGYTHARILEDPDYAGNEPVNVPHHTGSLYLTYDFGEIDSRGDSLKLGGGVRAVGRRAGINTNAYYLPGYMVADAFAAYTWKNDRPLTLQLNLKNIFNKTYYTSSIGTTALGNQIGEPFSAVLTASVQF